MTELQSTSHLSEQRLISLLKEDYLTFCLNYNLSDSQSNLRFEVISKHNANMYNEFCLLGNGIIGVNLQNIEPNSKSIVLSCGVHGNETAPIEICNDLINNLLSGKMSSPHRILFIFANIPSMHIKKRFVQENLNRLFFKNIDSNNQERIRAQELMMSVDRFFRESLNERIHYDLHTAIRPSKNEKFAVYPYLHGKPYNKKQLAFLSMCGVNTILLSQSPTTTFSYYSSFHHNADSFTVELGKVKPFGQNDMSKFTQVKESLTKLICEQDINLPEYEECAMEIFTVNQVINKQKPDFKLHFSDDLANFEGFSKGAVIASEQGKEYFAEYEGEAIVFPNADVEIGQRALLTVIPYQL